jgi:hypothetical protein
MAGDFTGNEDFLQIALIEVPPYAQGQVSRNSPCVPERLASVKEWFITTPSVALLTDGQVISAWEEKTPDLDTIFKFMSKRDFQGNHWTSSGRGLSGNDNYSKVYW